MNPTQRLPGLGQSLCLCHIARERGKTSSQEERPTNGRITGVDP